MRIGIVGLNGRMSKVVIEEINNHPECTVSGALVRDKSQESSITLYDKVEELADVSDAIIDFSTSSTSLSIIKDLSNSNVTLVCGTTGFSAKEFEAFKAPSITLIYSANMSIGINLLQKLLKTTSSKLSDDFDSAIIDIHHKHKKDSPSGTALMLASTIEEVRRNKVQISDLRIGEVPGEHSVIFTNKDESITLSHKAFNRNIFAKGAITACLWGKDKKPGLYSMQDVLND
ncbi:MAG: 4-hydroxy-tetrahydrodipicolinate reductase [Rickettsiales bacterium]|jgi:4-hydroxy-tetrahydrodipicolinate reductase|nr:4-hydroxy-tetrahydrodipicolinate reductase [Rickettsiales bacterium]